jgi:hypothetical protein
MSPILFAVAITLAAPLPARTADETYTINVYKRKAGDLTKVTATMKSVESVKYNLGQRNVTDEQKSEDEQSYTEEILAHPADADRPTKFRRTYHSKSTTDSAAVKTDSPLVGKTVEVDRTKKKPAFTVDSKPPTGKLLETLEKQFPEDAVPIVSLKDMLPGKAVKVGDTWTIDKKKILPEMKDLLLPETVLDEDKATFVGKLLKVESKDGGVYGVIECAYTMPVKKYPLNEQMVVDADAGSVVTVKEIHTLRIDGGAPDGKSETVFNVTVKAKLPNGKLEVKSTITMIDTEEVVKKAK